MHSDNEIDNLMQHLPRMKRKQFVMCPEFLGKMIGEINTEISHYYSETTITVTADNELGILAMGLYIEEDLAVPAIADLLIVLSCGRDDPSLQRAILENRSLERTWGEEEDEE